MKKMMWIVIVILAHVTMNSCSKSGTGNEDYSNIETPRTNPVPGVLTGRWAIIGISGSTVYDIPAGSTWNTNEMFLGFQINKDGTIREDGYLATYQYGLSTWAKWSAVGSIELSGDGFILHRARGSYTSSRNASSTYFGNDEVYPHKSTFYAAYNFGKNARGEETMVVENNAGETITYVKQ